MYGSRFIGTMMSQWLCGNIHVCDGRGRVITTCYCHFHGGLVVGRYYYTVTHRRLRQVC